MSDDAVENNSEGVGNNSHTRCDYTASFPAEPFVEDRAAMVRNAALEEAAKACEAQECGEQGEWGAGADATVRRCAEAIRALKTS